ncbi:polysaccharide deacetylase family protein [Actinomadura barringtoniae]|nr:polysaccharide deacetylase family protein [Actinomadura barringtoniae]
MAARPPASNPKHTQTPASQVDCTKAKCVALTFDDGPGEYTGKLLDDLREAGAHATFFMLGENVKGHEVLLKRMVAEGHELGNHSWSHPQLTSLSSGAVRSQVRRTSHVIEAASGVRPTLFRPPYGATDKRVGHAVGMPEILWSVDTLDWEYRNVARNVRVGTHEPKVGGIVLFHDIHKTSVEAIPRVLRGLKKRGFTFATVSQVLQGTKLKPGHTYLENVPVKAHKPKPKPATTAPNGTPPAAPSGAPSAPSGTPSAPATTPPASPSMPPTPSLSPSVTP